MIYVDDSGAEAQGLIVYGWVEVSPPEWRVALRMWLEVRKQLVAQYNVPVPQELHATEFINGRATIYTNPPPRFVTAQGVVLKKDLGHAVAIDCLTALRDCPQIRVGAVYRQTQARGADYAREKYRLYADLIRRIDGQLAVTGSFGFITMDGQDQLYRQAHRALDLDSRHVIEDPAFHDSKHSQWTQMADLVSYSAYLHLTNRPGKEFGRDWFRDYLGASAAAGEPELI